MLSFVPLATSSFAATYLAEGYSIRVWQTQDGLPQNLVTSAVQTHDGFLWFGTYSGLARFDGERFKVFDSVNTPALRDRRIASLFEDATGTLWIGQESGGITRYHAGRFDPFARPLGTMGEKVIGLGADEKERLWAMRVSGAVDSLDGGERLPSLIAPALPGVMSWSAGARGNIWLSENGQAAHLDAGRLAPVSLPPPRTENYVRCVAAALDGGVWVFCDGRIREWRDGRWTEDRGDFPWPEGSLACALELRDGTLAVGTIYSGLYLIFRNSRRPVHLDRSNGLPQDWVRFLYEDHEGNLWLGAGSASLVSVHASAFSVLNSPDQWQGCTVLSVARGRNGALWIGTDGATLYHYVGGKWSHYGDAEGLGNRYIPSVTETAQGEVWASPFWWGGPFRLENGKFVRPEMVDEKTSPVFALLAVPATGELLVGNRDGLLQLKGDRSQWLIKSPGDSAGAVCAIVRDRQGAISCGFAEGGLARLADGKVSFYRHKDGLASDSVQCLFLDDDGALWIGTADRGLSRFKHGRFANLDVAQGLADDVICHILDDGLGYLWLSTHHGIQRVAKTELNRCADGAIPAVSSQIYDHSDGLPVIEFTGGLQAAGCRTTDGRLMFASSKGVVTVDPARIEPNPAPPPVVIESLAVDGQDAPFAQGLLAGRLRPDHERLEFQFSGLSFVAPNKVRFKYRLDGIDKNWVETGNRRAASYSRLPAGTYRFRVIACNNDGVWNTAGASLAFTVAPFFWQTWWFIGASALVVLSGVGWLVRSLTRRRLQQRLEQLERQHAVERERTRIARDIHDDLGTSLTRIAMLSQPTGGKMDPPQQTTAMLARIYATARDVTRALDEIVWAVDPRHDTLDSLINYMGNFSQDLLSSAGIRCRLDLPVQLPPWPLTAETRHNLFLAFKEALNNTLKHARATEVHLSLQLTPDAFVLALRDNGCGFDSAAPAAAEAGRGAAGHGLPNLRRRLAHIGGRCEISSVAGKGTTVSFIVPAPHRGPPPGARGAGAPSANSRSAS